MKIAYITDIEKQDIKGGWNGINHNIYTQLSRYYDVDYIGPLKPDIFQGLGLVSKVQRLLNIPRYFFYFSEKRLEVIRKKFAEQELEPYDCLFFFGNTPWIKCISNKPYFVYLDADIRTFISVFLPNETFLQRDIDRISNLERIWLSKAKSIFFGSTWIKNITYSRYDMVHRKNDVIAKTGGSVDVPETDYFKYDRNSLVLTFISLRFIEKGGTYAFDVVECLKNMGIDVLLNIIGERPPDYVLESSLVNYIGVLDKSSPKDAMLFKDVLSSSAFLIHPTKMDTMGAVIPECAYFGCPAVASDRFGVPDLIIDGTTGFLIAEKECAPSIALKIKESYLDEGRYMAMRRATKLYAFKELSWEAIGLKITKRINESLNI